MSEESIKKWRETTIRKHGSMEAFVEWSRENGAKGGRLVAEKGLSGFKTMSRAEKSAAGKKGYQAMIAKAREKEEE